MKLFSVRSLSKKIMACLALTICMTSSLSAEFSSTINQSNQKSVERLPRSSFYQIFGYTDEGDSVQLTDSSKWSVRPKDQKKVTTWKKVHEIFIKPAYTACFLTSYFNSYNYVLYNRTLGQVAHVNLDLVQTHARIPAIFVQDIDYVQGLVILNDSTTWKIDPNDAYLNQWKIGDRVLIGVNNKWTTAEYPNIFINVNIPGKPYSKTIFYTY